MKTRRRLVLLIRYWLLLLLKKNEKKLNGTVCEIIYCNMCAPQVTIIWKDSKQAKHTNFSLRCNWQNNSQLPKKEKKIKIKCKKYETIRLKFFIEILFTRKTIIFPFDVNARAFCVLNNSRIVDFALKKYEKESDTSNNVTTPLKIWSAYLFFCFVQFKEKEDKKRSTFSLTLRKQLFVLLLLYE